MDVLTEQELQADPGTTASSNLSIYVAAVFYALLVCAAAVHHEAWADEAQSWLLARDASLADLWSRLLHYEGTTGLWQTLLHGLILAGLPYRAMSFLSALFGLGAACIVLWRAPLPRPIRLALPFTFFLAYQYSVIARSYVLLPLLAFCCAATYKNAQQKPLLFTGLLCLMAAVSVHGMVLAAAIGVSALVHSAHRRRFAVHVACFAAVVSVLVLASSPARDVTFIPGLNLSVENFFVASARAFATAFTSEWISSFVVVALSLPLLWRGGGWLFFVMSSFLLCAIASVVYSQVWHHGVLFLAWLFAIWISVHDERDRPKAYSTMAVTALAVVIAVQCYWTVCSITYDWQYPYSGSQAAAQGLRELDLSGKKLFGIGFACTAIQPYFAHNIFANVNEGRPEAYWDWSRRNHVNEDAMRLAESRPDYIVIGYKNEFELGIWSDLVRKGGYEIVRHFEGNTFWQANVLEPESYDLYRRSVVQ